VDAVIQAMLPGPLVSDKGITGLERNEESGGDDSEVVLFVYTLLKHLDKKIKSETSLKTRCFLCISTKLSYLEMYTDISVSFQRPKQ
jgi:hypothetical protein